MSGDRAELHLRVGPDLWAEPFRADDPALVEAIRAGARAGGIDGGLEIWCAGQRLGYAHLWDRLDGMLLAWLEALATLEAGADEALAVFPDTRVECELRRLSEHRVAIHYEDIDAQVTLTDLAALLEAACARLLSLTSEVGVDTTALRQLRAALSAARARRAQP